MRILGIDPGLRCTGFGVIEAERGALRYIASGTVRVDAAPALPERIGVLFEGVCEAARRFTPDVCAIEIVFVNVNPQATLLLGQARGACLAALAAQGLGVTEYTALQMKKAVAGYGKAGKAEVQQMVMRLLKLPGLPSPDAADALGLAITHAHAGAVLQRLARSAVS